MIKKDQCKNGHDWNDPDNVYIRKDRNGGRQCRECDRQASRRRRAENPEKFRSQERASYQRNKETALAYLRKKKFGLTPEDIKLMLESQNGICKICKTDTPGGRGDWHVDHDHETGLVRGLLCHKCNVGLGHFNDNIDRLSAAIEYLQNSKILEIADPT